MPHQEQMCFSSRSRQLVLLSGGWVSTGLRVQWLSISPLPVAGQGCPTWSLTFFTWEEAGSAEKSRGFGVCLQAWV